MGPDVGYDLARLWASADLDLVCCLESLDPAARRRYADNVRWVGVVGGDVAPAVPPPGPPHVLVSLSTNGFRGQRRTLQRIIDALGTLDVHGIVTTGEVYDPASFTAPPNVEVTGYADHAEIMSRCSLVISHGGHSTAFRALARGIPLVLLPTSRMTDQPMVAASIAGAGAGIRLPRSASSARIGRAVRAALTDPGIRGAAARIGSRIRAQHAADGVVAALADPALL